MSLFNLSPITAMTFNGSNVLQLLKNTSNFWKKVSTLVTYYVWETSGYYRTDTEYVSDGYYSYWSYVVSDGYMASDSYYVSQTCSSTENVWCFFPGGCVEGQYDAAGNWYPGACYEPQDYICDVVTNYYECGYTEYTSYWVDTSYTVDGYDWIDTSYYQDVQVWVDTSQDVAYQRTDISYQIG